MCSFRPGSARRCRSSASQEEGKEAMFSGSGDFEVEKAVMSRKEEASR